LDRQAAFHGADPYAVLGAEYDATDEALRKLFRQLSRSLHPDRFSGLQHEVATAAFAGVSAAAETLLDSSCDARAKIDAVVADARAELVAAGGALGLTTLRQRVTEILLELEWKQECHAAQLHEAEMSESEPLVVNLEAAGGSGKRGRRRAREKEGTFGRPVDWTVPTRHLYVANTGPKFDVSPGELKELLDRRFAEENAGAASNGAATAVPGVVERVTVIKPKLPFVYVTFSSVAAAEQARRSLDRRVAGSQVFHPTFPTLHHSPIVRLHGCVLLVVPPSCMRAALRSPRLCHTRYRVAAWRTVDHGRVC